MCLNHKVSPPHFPSTTSEISIFITILLDGTSIYYALKGRLASRYVHVTRRDIEVVTDIHCFFETFYSGPPLLTTEHCSLFCFFCFNLLALSLLRDVSKKQISTSGRCVALQTFLPCLVNFFHSS